MVVCIFSVGRRPATPETYQSAVQSADQRRIFTPLQDLCRNFRENFEAQNPHPEIFDPNLDNFLKISSHHTRFVMWIFSQSVGVRVDRRRKPTYQLTAAQGPRIHVVMYSDISGDNAQLHCVHSMLLV
jgi:hypothetical protein